jgi:hypothetical protein
VFLFFVGVSLFVGFIATVSSLAITSEASPDNLDHQKVVMQQYMAIRNAPKQFQEIVEEYFRNKEEVRGFFCFFKCSLLDFVV